MVNSLDRNTYVPYNHISDFIYEWPKQVNTFCRINHDTYLTDAEARGALLFLDRIKDEGIDTHKWVRSDRDVSIYHPKYYGGSAGK